MTDLSDRFRRKLAGRYAIEGELGAGGVATAYLAHDLRHRRRVAVNVPRPELAAALDHELDHDRSLREIETTANLRHSHILLPLCDSVEVSESLAFVQLAELLLAEIERRRAALLTDR